MNKNGYRKQFGGCIQPASYSLNPQKLLEDLKTRLSTAYGRPLGYAELGETMGCSKSTAHHWFALSRQPQLLGFLCLLEHLSAADRQSFIQAWCRELPTIDHPRLRGAYKLLRKLVSKQVGLTIVTGHTAASRLFVLAALAHSWIRHFGRQPPLTGLVIQWPERLVPVPGVAQVDTHCHTLKLRELAHSLWPRLATSTARMVVFSELWSAAPDIRPELLRIAGRKHVVLAEEAAPLRMDLKVVAAPIHFLSISGCTGEDGEIHICQA